MKKTKKLLRLWSLMLALLVGSVGNVWADTVKEWDATGTIEYSNALSPTVAKDGGDASYWTGYNFGTNLTKAVKMETKTTITFSTSANATVEIGISTKNNNACKEANSNVKFDGNATPNILTADKNKNDGYAFKIVTIENVEKGDHTIARNNAEIGVYYIKVTESSTPATPLTTFEWSKTSDEITVGDSYTSPTFSAATSEGAVTISDAVSFASSNTDLATVADDGTVTLAENATGTATITATVKSGYSATASPATYTVTVNAAKTQWNKPTFAVGAWNATAKAYPVTISAETGATIQYSTDGTNYSTYSTAVNVGAEKTIYAKATGTGYSDSEVASQKMEAAPASYLVRAEYNTTSKKADVTGTMSGATTDVSVSSSGKLDSKKRFGVKAADGSTFKSGDLVKLHFTAEGGTNEWYVFNSATADDDHLICSSTTGGNVKDYQFTLNTNQPAIYLVRNDKDDATAKYNTWNPTLGYIQVDRPTSYSLDGVKADDATLATTDYSVAGNVITFTDSYTTAPTVALIQKGTFADETSTSVDIPVTLSKSGDNFTGNALVGTTTYTVNVPVKVASKAPEITTDINPSYEIEKNASQELTIAATGADSYQWYKNTSASTEGATEISGATSDSYTYTGTTKGTEYVYCTATNTVGSTNSTVAAITTKGSSACELDSILFSNGIYGAIGMNGSGDTTRVDGVITSIKITVPYLAGTTAPSVETTWQSDGATYDKTTNVLTAEDGATSITYTIETKAITQLVVDADVATKDFTAVPSWVFNPYGFDGESSSPKGLKFAKADNVSGGNKRISRGTTRQYYFISPAQKLTLTSATTSRNINVYVNGNKLNKPTASGDKNATIDIELDPNKNNLVCIESAQSNGDGGFSKYAITAVTTPVYDAASLTLAATDGNNYWATYSNDNNVTFWPAANAEVKKVSVSDSKMTLTNLTTATGNSVEGYFVPKSTGVLVKASGTSVVYYTVTGKVVTALTDNMLYAASVAKDENYDGKYYMLAYGDLNVKSTLGFYWGNSTGSAFTSRTGAAYLAVPSSQAPSHFVFEEEEEVATDLNAAENTDEVVKFFEDGQLFIRKNGHVYNAIGQVVK